MVDSRGIYGQALGSVPAQINGEIAQIFVVACAGCSVRCLYLTPSFLLLRMLSRFECLTK